MKGSGASTAEALDELRKMDIPEGGEAVGAVSKLDPLSFYTGRVARTFGENPDESIQKDLTNYIDRQNRTINSITGELSWNYGTGIAVVDTPRSQGAAGFLSKLDKIELTDVAIESNNEFSSVMVISLDNQPLKTSSKILIQAMTQEQPYGFKVEDGKITDLGGAPFGVKKIDARISIRLEGAGGPAVTALDENGYATSKPVSTSGDGVKMPLVIQLAEDSIYHVVQR
jgi:hypothetical protein